MYLTMLLHTLNTYKYIAYYFFSSIMGDSTSQDLVLLMPEKSEEIIIKPKTLEKNHVTEERSRWNFESRVRFPRIQNRSASVLSSEPSNSEMTEMEEFSEETESKGFPRIQNISASVLPKVI